MGFLSNSKERLRLLRMRRQLWNEPRPHGLAELARAYLAVGGDSMAQEVLEFGRSLFPDSEELNRVQVLFVSGEKQSQLSALKESVRRTGTAQAYLELADEYRRLGDGDHRVSVLRQMLELFGEHCSALSQLGKVRFDRFVRNFAAVEGLAAEGLLKRAIAADGEALKPRFYLADLYFRTGALKAARETLAKLLELSPAHENAEQMRGRLEKLESDGQKPLEDFRSMLVLAEERRSLKNPNPPWDNDPTHLPEVGGLIDDPAEEVQRLSEQTCARQGLLMNSDGRKWGVKPSEVLEEVSSGLSSLCQRTARGMELGAPTRLLVEGASGAFLMEMKQETVLSLVLPEGSDFRSASVAASDALEMLSRSGQ
ncbi:MAG: tetratricopeptide repeat protein [Planctomycetota bacterium]